MQATGWEEAPGAPASQCEGAATRGPDNKRACLPGLPIEAAAGRQAASGAAAHAGGVAQGPPGAPCPSLPRSVTACQPLIIMDCCNQLLGSAQGTVAASLHAYKPANTVRHFAYSRAEVSVVAGVATPLSLWLRVSRCLRPPELHVDLDALAARGWCALPPSPLQLRLLQLVRHFLMQDAATKDAWVDPCDGARHYTRLQGGREAFTVRDGCLLPALRRPARRAWRHLMQLSHATLRRVEPAAPGPAGRLIELLEPGRLPAAPKSASLLRHFRCPPPAAPGAQVVGAHADLGLLSFCLEDTPGLEVWDRRAGAWRRPPLGAVAVLAGEALTLVTGGAVLPSRHRVVLGAARPRTSQVFHLRLRTDALLDSARLHLPPGRAPFHVTAREFLQQQLSRGPGVNVPLTARVNPRGA